LSLALKRVVHGGVPGLEDGEGKIEESPTVPLLREEWSNDRGVHGIAVIDEDNIGEGEVVQRPREQLHATDFILINLDCAHRILRLLSRGLCPRNGGG
jgi:hypothetical protein